MPTYYSIITNNGLISHANASANEVNLDLAEMAVGDSNGVYYDPDGTETALQNELYRVDLTHVVIDENNPNQLIIEAVLDEVVGPFYIREVGIFDSNGDLFAIGKFPETFKPNLPSGSGKRLYIRMILGFASSPNVNLIINNDISLDPNFSTDVNNALAERLIKTNNLSDLENLETARNNLEVYGKNYLNSKIGKNYIINGNFDIWQRGEVANSKVGTGYFAPDRFDFDTAGATVNISKQAFPIGQIEVPNNPRNFLRYELTAPGSPNAILYHKVEDVRILAGQTCTLSFYAKASSAINLATDFQQVFGSGGSATVDGNPDKIEHNISTSWQKFTATFDFYPISGKTLGAVHFLQMRWYFSNAANVTIDFAQIQLEKGSVATDFEHKTFAEELALCQRYRCASGSLDEYYQLPSGSGTQIQRQTITFPVPMRSAPTVSVTRNSGTANTGTIVEVTEKGFRQAFSGGQFEYAEYSWIADAEL